MKTPISNENLQAQWWLSSGTGIKEVYAKNAHYNDGITHNARDSVTGLCAGNSPATGEFPAQISSYAKNVSIWWRHHGIWKTWLLFVVNAVKSLYGFTSSIDQGSLNLQSAYKIAGFKLKSCKQKSIQTLIMIFVDRRGQCFHSRSNPRLMLIRMNKCLSIKGGCKPLLIKWCQSNITGCYIHQCLLRCYVLWYVLSWFI